MVYLKNGIWCQMCSRLDMALPSYSDVHKTRKTILRVAWNLERRGPLYKMGLWEPIKDDPPDADKARSITEQETIAGGNVKYVAWMFQTQPLDALHAHAPGSAGTVNKALALVRGGVHAVTCMFEVPPLDSTNKIYHYEEQTSDETHIWEVSSGAVKNLRHMLEVQNLETWAGLPSGCA